MDGERIMANHLFISYKHKRDSAKVALRFYEYLSAVAGGLGFTVFMDTEIDAADVWTLEIEKELEKTTHFICLLTTSYWTAEQCQLELSFALDKFNEKGSPRILFVLVEDLDPQWLKFDKATGKPKLKGDGKIIKSVGDINFLGPFNENRQLVRMQYENDAKLQDQFYKLVKRIAKVL